MTCNRFFMSERENLENSIFLILTDFNDFGILSNVNLYINAGNRDKTGKTPIM